jgi:uncharacterized protein YdeI (YjbR/CyaY-like superfamily)
MTWSESVEQALCFGWIDGVRQSIDKESYQIRFTPRRPGSIWSNVNTKKFEELVKSGFMQPSGFASFEHRTEKKAGIYSFEQKEVKFSADFIKQFKANKKAWKYFQSLARSYQKTSTNWVMSAKQETTRLKRLMQLMADSESGTNRWKDNKYIKKYE